MFAARQNFMPFGTSIVPPTPTSYGDFIGINYTGYKVAISGDGYLAAAITDSSGNGTVVGYNGTNWQAIGATTYSTRSIAISENGLIRVSGEPIANTVRISNGIIITAPLGLAFSFGDAVDLNNDGSRCIIAGYNGPISSIFNIYIYDNGVLVGQINDAGTTASEIFGSDIAISNDGQYIAAPIGMQGVNIFRNINGVWTKIYSSPDNYLFFHRSLNRVAFSGDGKILATGGSWVYGINQNTVTVLQSGATGNTSPSDLITAVDVNYDGSRIVYSTAGTNINVNPGILGSASLYIRTGTNTWKFNRALLPDPNWVVRGTMYGMDIAIDNYGDTVIIGAKDYDEPNSHTGRFVIFNI